MCYKRHCLQRGDSWKPCELPVTTTPTCEFYDGPMGIFLQQDLWPSSVSYPISDHAGVSLMFRLSTQIAVAVAVLPHRKPY